MPRIKKDYVTRCGVYLDLDKSPYIYKDKLGNEFVFSSQKKMNIYTRELEKLQERCAEERRNLEKLGYVWDDKSYEKGFNCLPLKLFNDIIAPKGERYGKIKEK